MAHEKELEEQMCALVMAVEALTQRIAEMQVDLVNHRHTMERLADETNTLSDIIETEQQQRRAK